MANDPYMNHKAKSDRLYDEWKKYGSLIVAVDYDDTLFDFHKKGHTYNNVIDLLRRCKKLGAKIIVFSCCGPDQYDEMRAYLDANEIPYDAINEDLLPQPFAGRKIYYNSFLDDRAGLEAEFKALEVAVYYMEKELSKS